MPCVRHHVSNAANKACLAAANPSNRGSTDARMSFRRSNSVRYLKQQLHVGWMALKTRGMSPTPVGLTALRCTPHLCMYPASVHGIIKLPVSNLYAATPALDCHHCGVLLQGCKPCLPAAYLALPSFTFCSNKYCSLSTILSTVCVTPLAALAATC